LETFILWLLRYNGSHSIIRECPECDHIAPQVGTLVAANVLQADLNVFKLEAFDRGWETIAEQAGIPKELMTVRSSESKSSMKDVNRLLNHGSSEDQFNISSNALNYFGLQFLNTVASRGSLMSRGSARRVVSSAEHDKKKERKKKKKNEGGEKKRTQENSFSSNRLGANDEKNAKKTSVKEHGETSGSLNRKTAFLRAVCRMYLIDFVCLRCKYHFL
jgi:hypothetical protein